MHAAVKIVYIFKSVLLQILNLKKIRINQRLTSKFEFKFVQYK